MAVIERLICIKEAKKMEAIRVPSKKRRSKWTKTRGPSNVKCRRARLFRRKKMEVIKNGAMRQIEEDTR